MSRRDLAAPGASRSSCPTSEISAFHSAQPRPRDQAAAQPGDVELGLEQWACHDHLPTGASSQVPSTSRPAGDLPLDSKRSSCQLVARDHLVITGLTVRGAALDVTTENPNGDV